MAISEKEDKGIRESFLDKIQRIQRLHELTEKINYPSLLLFQLQQIQMANIMGDEYGFQSGVNHLLDMIPGSWVQSDGEFEKRIKKIEEQREGEEEKFLEYLEGLDEEESPDRVIDYSGYYRAVFNAIVDLFDRKQILMTSRPKQVTPEKSWKLKLE